MPKVTTLNWALPQVSVACFSRRTCAISRSFTAIGCAQGRMHSGIMLIPLRRYSAGEIVRVCFGL